VVFLLYPSPLLPGDPPRRGYYFQPLTLSFMSSVAPYASTTNVPIPMEIDAGRAPDKRQPLQPRCSHPGERERWGCHLLQIDVHWIVLVGGSAGRAEDDVAFPAGSELSQSNPGGFESVLGVFLSGFNV